MERKFHVSNKKSLSRVRSVRRRPGCIRLFVCPTTGGRMEISVSPRETVFGLKAALARKLRVSPSKISLIYKDKVLRDGCIQDHNILDDSQVTLLPNMESGLSVNRSDRSIIQALENLTETQVNDFLSGRSPLMLAIRMGENMVFVQLQLSMLHPATPQRDVPSYNSTSASASTTTDTQERNHQLNMNNAASRHNHHQVHKQFQAPSAVTLNSASALAEATRCLSQRLNRFHELNCQSQRASKNVTGDCSRIHPTAQMTAGLDTPPTSPTSVTSGPAQASVSPMSQQPQQQHQTTAFPLPPPSSSSGATASCNAGTTTSLSSVPVNMAAPPSPPPSPGAIIDTMKSLGRGIYSGTFQGTLDPSLQDGQGRPRRSVNTILHILNDLLVAAPSPPQPHVTTTPGITKIGPMQKLSNLLTPPPSPTTNASTGPSKPIPVNKPSSSSAALASTHAPAMKSEENPDNALLRGKMQRVQMMLAQRKEQRRTRREMGAPYYTPSPSNLSFLHSHNSSRQMVMPLKSSISTGEQALEKSALGAKLSAVVPSQPSSVCMAPVEPSTASPSALSEPPSALTQAVDDSACMEDLQQGQQQQTSGTACGNGGDHPCQTCAYCNPSREQDSLAV
ncbi:midnolin-like [Plakobranchus ocellatus]|uniref:Midnolin-like n=1 Tax=Plakobranchus ocellatus TaxID=259542 RepID=A0AAV4BEN9_9GAST|nr:midnolin-like [Plakobranchus ocellatus]